MRRNYKMGLKPLAIIGLAGLSALTGCAGTGKVMEQASALVKPEPKPSPTVPKYLEVSDQGIMLEVTLRDFSSNFPDFENFNSKKPNPGIQDCGSLEQTELSNAEFKDSFLISLRERYPNQFPWATSNSREIYPTFGMLKTKLGEDGLPQKGRQACNNDHIDQWYKDIAGVNFKVQDKLELKPVGEDVYKVEFLHFNNNSYLPLDKFAGSQDVKNWGKQNLPTWCLDNIAECQKISDEQGLQPNSVPDGSNFGFTMTTEFDFVYNSAYGEYFEFDGDDDYWLFIDGELAVDAGGTHVLIHNLVQLDSIAQERGWLDGSTHHFKLFFAERQADASNLSMSFKTKGIKDVKTIPPYIYRSYKLGQSEEDNKYLIYVNAKLDGVSLTKIQKNLDKQIFKITDEMDNDVTGDMQVKSFKPVDSTALPKGVQAAYEIEFENSAETRFVAPSLGYKISFDPSAPVVIKSEKGLQVKSLHHAKVQSLGEPQLKAATTELQK